MVVIIVFAVFRVFVVQLGDACVCMWCQGDFCVITWCGCFFFFQAEDGIRDLVRSRGLGDVYKRQA